LLWQLWPTAYGEPVDPIEPSAVLLPQAKVEVMRERAKAKRGLRHNGDLLKRRRPWETEPDELGRSQKWKIVALREDQESNKDSGIVQSFIREVEETVDLLERVTPVIKALCKKSMEESGSISKNSVSVEPITPHGI
jgi:hypothetical protein